MNASRTIMCEKRYKAESPVGGARWSIAMSKGIRKQARKIKVRERIPQIKREIGIFYDTQMNCPDGHMNMCIAK